MQHLDFDALYLQPGPFFLKYVSYVDQRLGVSSQFPPIQLTEDQISQSAEFLVDRLSKGNPDIMIIVLAVSVLLVIITCKILPGKATTNPDQLAALHRRFDAIDRQIAKNKCNCRTRNLGSEASEQT
ncbi:hypothetical protein PCANC_04443 [Puccinia coronata f. sp. avenae]|uniref:Uncharacterized protein n=1 Tax=Puccinia coronata f. sp. avenae TaxID=200324 RepID=A0A2N5VUS5_9BASI|nr:hypothetical protein PCANC_04443 [Puccinia coronata f. sp. avenae]